MPMRGVPARTAEAAIARLLAAGRKVAVSEQFAEPAGDRPLRCEDIRPFSGEIFTA